MKTVHIVGKRNHGKTTLVEALVRVLIARGLKVGTIKHCGHPHDLDIPGKDSYRHQAAGAEATMVVTPDRIAMHRPRPVGQDMDDTLERCFSGCDIVLCEGWLDAVGMKVEVWREAVGGSPLAASHRDIVAIVTDDVPPVSREVWPRADIGAVADRVLQLCREAPSRGSRGTKQEEDEMNEPVSPHDPLILFVEGHDGVSEWLHNLEAAARIRDQRESSPGFDEIVNYFRENVRAHFAFEEETVFPALLDVEPSAELRRLTADLRIQHIEIVNEVSQMFQEMAIEAAGADEILSSRVRAKVSSIVEKILAHAALEDHHLLPLLKAHRDEIRDIVVARGTADSDQPE